MTGARSKGAARNTAEALKPADDRKFGKRKAPVDRSNKLKAQKEKKAKKDPNRPKRPPSAFFVFLEEFRATFKRENPNVKAVSANFWQFHLMFMKEKAVYEAKAAKRKADYEKQMNVYNKKQESAANGELNDEEDEEVNDEEEGKHQPDNEEEEEEEDDDDDDDDED
ncbi:hypothetical protein DITRI_Ditri06bG0086800 [Diplodiscus trichospermus]